ncbi:hypothetical protein, partial [Gemmatimonas sp.]|uniref:hypothetical protein n=1 Tax=Gemmatimonas sp. TaxID=1962908 RepID=UPI00391F18D1
RWAWTFIQTCLVLGSVFFATGLLGEQIAQQRSEVREMRRELSELAANQFEQDDSGAVRDAARDAR